MQASTNSITFYTKAQTYFGQHVVIFGNTPELGNGDINQGLKLTNNEGAYNYKITINFNENPEGKWYKYALVDKSQHTIDYERIADRVIPKFNTAVCLRDTFDLAPVFNGVVVNIRIPFYTQFGQNLFLIGDSPHLGSWDINAAFPLRYIDSQYWGGSIVLPLSKESRTFHYKCFVRNDWNGDLIWEPGDDHVFTIAPTPNPSIYEVIDPFRWREDVAQGLATSPFTEVFNQREKSQKKVVLETNETPDTVSIKFSILCPAPKQGQTMKIAGSCNELGWWQPDKALTLSDNEFPTWTAVAKIPRTSLPFEYKYIMCDPYGQVIWESRANRFLTPADVPGVDQSCPVSLYCHDWIPSIYTKPQRGLCLRVDLPNVWTRKSAGCGQFGDLCRVVDFCKRVGASMIQVSNVYDEKSAFALDPVFIDVLNINDVPADVKTMMNNFQANQEEQPVVDLDATRSFKLAALKKIFDRVQKPKQFDEFKKKNDDWLSRWQKFNRKDEPEFVAWVQYIADEQLHQVREYAKANYVALRGEAPLTVPVDSCDVQMYPGAFSGFEEVYDGQKLGGATFSWNDASKQWWQQRIERHSSFFHSIKIDNVDHIVQIGECPPNMLPSTAHLQQDKPFSKEELKEKKLWDIPRYTKPYLRAKLLPSYFGDDAKYVESRYFTVRGTGPRDKLLSFNCQSINDVEPKFRPQIEKMLSDVILTESLGKYYTVGNLGTSWQELPEPQKSIFLQLTHQSSADKPQVMLQNDSRAKVRQITQTGSNIEVIGNDGFYDIEMTKEADQLKQRWWRFTDTRNLPFGCVSVLGSNIQQWWHDNREEAEKYWREELWRTDTCPLELPQWALECIIRMHMWCGAQWAVIPLDDIASLGNHKRAKAGAKSPYPIDDIVNDNELVNKVASIINDSGRKIEF